MFEAINLKDFQPRNFLEKIKISKNDGVMNENQEI